MSFLRDELAIKRKHPYTDWDNKYLLEVQNFVVASKKGAAGCKCENGFPKFRYSLNMTRFPVSEDSDNVESLKQQMDALGHTVKADITFGSENVKKSYESDKTPPKTSKRKTPPANAFDSSGLSSTEDVSSPSNRPKKKRKTVPSNAPLDENMTLNQLSNLATSAKANVSLPLSSNEQNSNYVNESPDAMALDTPKSEEDSFEEVVDIEVEENIGKSPTRGIPMSDLFAQQDNDESSSGSSQENVLESEDNDDD